MKRRIHDEKARRRYARQTRVRKQMLRSQRAQLCIFRSTRHIYAQLIDAETGRTLTTVSSLSKGVVDGATGNIEAAKKVGAAIAEAARAKDIDQVVLNRNGFLFHGRVKALADAAREAGLRF